MGETMERPIIGITMGDPAGIGPEIVIKAFEEGGLYGICRPLVLGDRGCLQRAGSVLGSRLALNPVLRPAEGGYLKGTMDVLEVSHLAVNRITWGRPTPETGRAMVSYIERAADLALVGELAGMVTCPINKKALAGAGVDFPGHTELLAQRTGARRVVMMLAGPRLRVVLVTIHLALSRVPQVLSQGDILETIEITAQSLQDRFGLASPRLAVAGLNPHAGEGGLFGDEEQRLIRPAVEAARRAGIDATGPFPPDTVFYQAAGGSFDGVVCMYHDQGLIPFKLLHFEEGVNTTLGLPIIRTSVDHGTAYDIAGTGRANARSLMAAIRMAAEQAVHLRP
jgi:4-hydroxythreonine-4-phosphate dehydrogenase